VSLALNPRVTLCTLVVCWLIQRLLNRIRSRADDLHASNDMDALFSLLQGADTDEADVAWRVARAHHDKAQDSEEAANDPALKEHLLREGLAIAEAAKASGSGYALKWYAILLGRLGDFLPTKEKVGNSYKIRESLESAAELLPEDASVQTALGQWCFKVASISWIERNVAKALFGAPPESTFDEALRYLERSHDLRPSKKAALFAGLSQLKRSEPAEAKRWFELCLGLESVGEDDKELDVQATSELARC
jgi:tetratricopeptide (TPR) repeat protein